MDLRVQKGHRIVSILHPRMQGESLRILLNLYWRPRRDLNPCYRRESALNLVLNLGFERFHQAATADGAVHTFELGVVRDLPAPEGIDLPPVPKSARNRR